jgi:hypothetical protein
VIPASRNWASLINLASSKLRNRIIWSLDR